MENGKPKLTRAEILNIVNHIDSAKQYYRECLEQTAKMSEDFEHEGQTKQSIQNYWKARIKSSEVLGEKLFEVREI